MIETIESKEEIYFQYYQKAVDMFNKHIPQQQLYQENQVDLLNNPQFRSLMQHSPGILGIIDFHSRNYIYMSENVKSILGFEPEYFYDNTFEKLVTLFPGIHNEIIINKIFPLMFQYFDKYTLTNNVKDLRVSYNSLMIREDGSIGCFLHQITVIHTNEFNKPDFLLKLMADISDIKKDSNITMSVSEKDDKGIFKPIFSQNFIVDSNIQLLSSRELEILHLLKQGKSSGEVGDLLCISENTVYKHRKNMLKKMDAKNTGELLSKAIANGLI